MTEPPKPEPKPRPRDLTEGVALARTLGHDMISDPPANTLSNMDRYSCKKCWRAVLGNGSTVYGSAIEIDCIRTT